MPSTCNEYGCDGAVIMIDDNGATNPTRDRWEQYECEFGHVFSVTLPGVDR